MLSQQEFNSKLQAGGLNPDFFGVGNTMYNNYVQDPVTQIQDNKPPDLQHLYALLQNMQQKNLGLAGQQAGAYAASKGYNPNSFIQHAQAPIYGDYAQHFANIPQQQFGMQNQWNNSLLQALQYHLQKKQYEDSQSGGLGSFLGSALGFLPGIGGLLGKGISSMSNSSAVPARGGYGMT